MQNVTAGHNLYIMEVLAFTLTASLAALGGAFAALKSRKWLDKTLALTTGLVLGLVAFDLLPEVFNISASQHLDTAYPMIAMVFGFLLFHLFERQLPMHESAEGAYGAHQHPQLGVARAIALSGHSFMDGLSIGVAFQINSTVGLAVSLAVIGHRFADGFDTTTFMVFHKNKLRSIRNWLSVVVVMPIAGGLLSLVINFSEKALAIYLGFFAGLMIYIAASNLLPQAHSENKSRGSFALTLAGVVFLFIVTRLA